MRNPMLHVADMNDGSISSMKRIQPTLALKLYAIRMLLVSIMLLSVGVLPPLAAASTCSGTHPNLTAASSSQADVQDCLTAAVDGDTINVPAGTSTWSAGGIFVNKSVTIAGAGSTLTKISASSSTCFSLDYTKNTRITGFQVTTCTIGGINNASVTGTFRVDHNKFVGNAGQWGNNENDFIGSCQTPQVHPTGLVDHNDISNYRFVVDSTNCILTDGNYATQQWAKQPPVGNSGTQNNGVPEEVVYFEDNTYHNTNTNGDTRNWVDGNQAGRYVVRFNTVDGHAFNFIEAHSEAGDNRATQWWEVYQNDISAIACGSDQGSPPCWFLGAYPRGGSGIYWGNVWPNTIFTQDLVINNLRSCSTEGGGQGKCGGTSTWDQNLSGQNGNACRDQIGRSYDTTLWTVPTGQYSQPLTPAYFFNNTHLSGTQLLVQVDSEGGDTGTCNGTDFTTADIQWNRDAYQTNGASCSGSTCSSGVGSGTLAARPANCTTGVGYWATDQGSWNQSGNGKGNGVLYQCTSTNTWTLYYTPYAYPHPLQNASSSAPNSPKNLSAVVN